MRALKRSRARAGRCWSWARPAREDHLLPLPDRLFLPSEQEGSLDRRRPRPAFCRSSGSTVPFALFRCSQPDEAQNSRCHVLYRQHQPIGRFLEMIAGVEKLCTFARTFEPDLIVINTCGLVNGGAARELKFHEIDMLSPRLDNRPAKNQPRSSISGPPMLTGRTAYSSASPYPPDARASTAEARRAAENSALRSISVARTFRRSRSMTSGSTVRASARESDWASATSISFRRSFRRS